MMSISHSFLGLFNLIYDRSEQNDGDGSINNSYWVANHIDPAQRHRVKWLKNQLTDEFIWVRIDESNNPLFPESNKAWQWVDGNWQLVDCQL